MLRAEQGGVYNRYGAFLLTFGTAQLARLVLLSFAHLGMGGRDCVDRKMTGVRIERYPAHKIVAMHNHFLAMADRDSRGGTRFALITAPLVNAFQACLPTHMVEAGNCARWTSSGLVAAGVLSWKINFPKSIFRAVFESQCRRDPDNVHVVAYIPPTHVKRRWSNYDPYLAGPMKPLHIVSSLSCTPSLSGVLLLAVMVVTVV